MKIYKKKYSILSILLLVFLMCMANETVAASDKKVQLINCDIQNQSCTQEISGGSITFDIHPKPVKAMEELTFEVRVSNVNLSEPPVIDLGMPGMKMGPNQVKMKKTNKGVYQGTGIIVRCPSGRTVWRATVNLPGIESIDFIFNVIY